MTFYIDPVAPAEFPPASEDVFLVQVKRAFIRAFRSAFDIEHPSSRIKKINLNMEYPMKAEEYPAIWFQFNFSGLEKVGIMDNFWDANMDEFHQWSFKGRITLNVLALTSKERDQISSEIIQAYAFSRNSQQGRKFRNSIAEEKYINISYNEDRLDSSGSTITVGTMFNPDQIVYEDGYSFDVVGQFRSNIDTQNVKTELTDITFTPIVSLVNSAPLPLDNDGDWV